MLSRLPLFGRPRTGRPCALLGRKQSMCYDSAINGTLLPVAEKTRSIKKPPYVPLRLSFTTSILWFSEGCGREPVVSQRLRGHHMKVLHAGSLTSLVRQGLGPACFQAHGIVVESEPGHSVALAMAIKEGRKQGDRSVSAPGRPAASISPGALA
jgi:hypothetical protein